ncbi:MAG: hypothetical protein IPN93_15385 [Bacteroidetes bacterium]|nr:hypothetical protein [Bacteroidota bacterium]
MNIPTIDTRFKIYRSLLKQLNDEDLQQLANAYDFIGGIIQNIVRKPHHQGYTWHTTQM